MAQFSFYCNSLSRFVCFHNHTTTSRLAELGVWSRVLEQLQSTLMAIYRHFCSLIERHRLILFNCDSSHSTVFFCFWSDRRHTCVWLVQMTVWCHNQKIYSPLTKCVVSRAIGCIVHPPLTMPRVATGHTHHCHPFALTSNSLPLVFIVVAIVTGTRSMHLLLIGLLSLVYSNWCIYSYLIEWHWVNKLPFKFFVSSLVPSSSCSWWSCFIHS